jgi:hypothetical protein
MPHFFGEAEGADEPAESGRNVLIENVGDDLSVDASFM